MSAGRATPIPADAETQRGDFIEQLLPIGISETLTFSPVGLSVLSIAASGAVVLTCDYTARRRGACGAVRSRIVPAGSVGGATAQAKAGTTTER